MKLLVSTFLFLVLPVLNSSAGAQVASQPDHALHMPATRSTESSGAPDLLSIVQRVEQTQEANPARYRPYALTREYKFYHGDTTQEPKSQVIAEVSFVPPNVKKFEILETHGSGRGTSVVKRMLETEADLAKDVTTHEISRRNYDFASGGETQINGRECYVLLLKPKREERSLFEGKAYIDAQSYRILQLEGQPARSPSWWLKSTHITLRYGDVDGLWLPVETNGTSELRIFGRYTLASQKIAQRVDAEVASLREPASRKKSHRGHVSDIGAAVPIR